MLLVQKRCGILNKMWINIGLPVLLLVIAVQCIETELSREAAFQGKCRFQNKLQIVILFVDEKNARSSLSFRVNEWINESVYGMRGTRERKRKKNIVAAITVASKYNIPNAFLQPFDVHSQRMLPFILCLRIAKNILEMVLFLARWTHFLTWFVHFFFFSVVSLFITFLLILLLFRHSRWFFVFDLTSNIRFSLHSNAHIEMSVYEIRECWNEKEKENILSSCECELITVNFSVYEMSSSVHAKCGYQNEMKTIWQMYTKAKPIYFPTLFASHFHFCQFHTYFPVLPMK